MYQPPAISPEDRASISLMPLPSSLKLSSGEFKIDSDFKISYDGYTDEILQEASGRFLIRLARRSKIDFQSGDEDARMIISCRNAGGSNEDLIHQDESYSLKIGKDRISLESNDPLGVVRGFETLLQLLETGENESFFPTVEIVDSPRFPWRGLMIDVSRHWMPKEVILRNLDAMASVKLNVLHLHLSDDQGFRVESRTFPKLHELGSRGKYFTQEDIKEIVKYAALRGIRILPEFDIPGHTKSWQIAYPELSSVSTPLSFVQEKGVFFSPALDPTREEVYDFLDKLFGEMAQLFPDPYMHIGGDEVNPTAWNENQRIVRFMQQNKLEDTYALQAYFILRIKDIVKKHNKIMVGWEEISNTDLGDNIILQSWKSQKSLFEAVQMGNSGILSAGYYLDHKLHAEKHYSVDPMVLPGAVDIVPDYENWKMYDIKIEIPGSTMDGQIILFDKDPKNVYGFFAFLDDRNAFKNGTVSNGNLVFDFTTPMGGLEFSAMIDEDTIDGSLSFGLLKFAARGNRSGGSDMAGTEMPKIEIIKPLTQDEKKRILGGEAAMWSEVVSSETIDSRIWPRTAAIAEKLWSSAELTDDVDDMYRRLNNVSKILSLEGSHHLSNYQPMLMELVGEDGYEDLKQLVDVMEEVKYVNRIIFLLEMDSLYLPDLPLDHIADIARPESLEARDFNQRVNRYIADPTENDKDIIFKQLEIWSNNHNDLEPFIGGDSRLQEIDSLSATFSKIAEILLNKKNEDMSLDELESLNNDLDFIENGENGVLIAVAPGLRKLGQSFLNGNSEK